MFSSLFSMSGFESVNKRYSNKRESINLDKAVSTNTFKTINNVRTLPLIKSKSFSSVKSRIDNAVNPSNCCDQLSSVNTTRRRLSWFERKTWSFRRGNKRNLKNMESSPDITIIFGKDAFEWDEYLTECFSQMIDYQPLTILHERIENIIFPIGSYEAQNFSNSRAVLLILSPDFLDFIDAHAEVYELSRLLNPKRTVVMLCGVQEQDISRFHKAALVSYDQWTCLVAKDQDKEFVLSVIQAVLLIIQQNEIQSTNKPQFKLSPRKVRQGNGKVFVLLESPISEKQQIDILFDGSNENRLTVKWKNPYVLYFTIPDSMLKVARVVNISLICDNKNLMGTRPLKCETKMSELHSVLTSVNSPFEFMCQTLGFATLSEVDAELANRFNQSLPNSGLMFLYDSDIVGAEKKKSDCYLPTLLHFAAAYGLREFTSKLLQCPSALKACQIRNSSNLTPAEIAYHLNHSDIGAILEDFERLCGSGSLYECEPILESELTDQEKANLRINAEYRHANSKLSAAHHQLYGIPFSPHLLQNKQRDKFLSSMKNNGSSHDQSIYSQMFNFEKQQTNNELDASKTNRFKSRLDITDKESTIKSKMEDLTQPNEKNTIKKSNKSDRSDSEVGSTLKSSSDLNDIHKELLYIIETFKKGMSFDKFESLFQNWQTKHQNVLSGNLSKEMNESLNQIQNLCKIGRRQQKAENINKQSFSFNDLRYYFTSRLHNKANENALRETVEERLHCLTIKNRAEDEQQSKYTAVSPSLSSISTSSSSSDRISTVSNASLFDSGNHSAESHDENSKFNSRNYHNNYYKHPKTKPTSLVAKLSQSEVRAQKSDSAHVIRCSKPPAPPPRPLNVPISEPNKFNESANLNHGQYYLYENDTKQSNSELDELDSDHYVMPFQAQNSLKDEYLSVDMKPIHNKRTKSHSLTDVNSHEYVNMISSKIESTVMAKRDPLIDYDLVPSGIPVPIGLLRGKVSLPIVPLRKQAEDDYDIPRSSQITASNEKVTPEKNSDYCNNEKNLQNDRNIDRQVFV